MIKFRTSEVPMSQSISRIEAMLVLNGASNIMKEYDRDGRLDALSFIMRIEGAVWPFKLPANANRIEEMLLAKIKRPGKESSAKARQQAERTAWKLACEWLDIELTLVEMRQRDIREVFFTSIYDAHTKKTFFEIQLEKRFKGIIAIPEKT